MARPVYAHELSDPDFAWLMTTYIEEHPGVMVIENAGAPVIIMNLGFVPDAAPASIQEDESNKSEAKKEP